MPYVGACVSLAIELGKRPTEVMGWPLDEVHLMLEGYKRKSEREREAMEKARKDAERESKLRR